MSLLGATKAYCLPPIEPGNLGGLNPGRSATEVEDLPWRDIDHAAAEEFMDLLQEAVRLGR